MTAAIPMGCFVQSLLGCASLSSLGKDLDNCITVNLISIRYRHYFVANGREQNMMPLRSGNAKYDTCVAELIEDGYDCIVRPCQN